MRAFILVVTIMVMLAATSCSRGNDNIISPGLKCPKVVEISSHQLWGLWQFIADPDKAAVDIAQLRSVDMHLNALVFLEPPPLVNLTLESLKFNGNIIEADIGLRHPFLGLTEFTGFDVCGILITNGSVSGFSDTKIKMAGEGDTHLLNPDGYSRWWNPVEFPVNNGTMFSYKDGLLGTPDSKANYNSTINGYKYFCDDLGTNDPLTNVTLEKRGMFSAGKKNIRHYTIEIGDDGLTFNYAVDACWLFPTGSKPWTAPDDFPPGANRPEAWRLGVTELSNSLWNSGTSSGGELHLGIDVYDWFKGNLNSILVESPGNFFPVTVTTPSGEGPGYSTYDIDITSAAPEASGPMDILICVKSEQENFQGFINGINTTAYFIHITQVASGPQLIVIAPNGGETLWMAMSYEIKWDPGSGGIADVKIEWSSDNFASDIQTIVASTENDGSYIWVPIPSVKTDTARVRVRDISGGASDTSDGDFSIDLPVWLEFQEEVEVDTTTVNFATWTPFLFEKWLDDFSPALSQDFDGMVHLVWHGEGIDTVQDKRLAYDPTIRSTDGVNWSGEGDFLHTEGPSGCPPFRTDNMKVARTKTHVSTTFAAVRCLPNTFYSRDVDRWINFATYFFTCINPGPVIFNNCEILADDDYLYHVADGWKPDISTPVWDGPGIYSMRVATPAPPDPFICTSETVLTDFGEISHSRSWCFHDGVLLMAYFTTDGKIKLLRQTDNAVDTWDDTEVIFDGSGYTGCKDPSIAVDNSGRLFAVWTGQENASGQYKLLASMKETPDGDWTEPIIAATSATLFDDQHISCSTEKVLLPTGDNEYLVLIGYQVGDIVYSQISPKDIWGVLPAQQVSADGDVTRDPDTLCLESPYQFDSLFAWSFKVDEDNWDIKFRNADFKTP